MLDFALPMVSGSDPTGAASRGRGVLLVEFFDPERFCDSKARAFPFVAGYARARGIPVRWICFSRATQRSSEDMFLVELLPEARRRFREEVAEVCATHVLFSEAPHPRFDRFLREEFRHLSFLHVGGREWHEGAFEKRWLVRWLALDDDQEGLLPDLEAPDYECCAAEAAAESARPPTALIGGPACVFAAPLRDNPCYRNVDLSGEVGSLGCTFCTRPASFKYRFRTPLIPLTLRQIKAAQSAPETLRCRNEFVVDSIQVFFEIEAFVASLDKERIPSSAFHFRCRPDEMLACVESVERALPAARRSGHQIHIVSMGVENFSSAENERFNKSVSAEDVRRALAHIASWEERYPDTFFFDRHGGLSFILFTPWSTLDDLRRNREFARDLRLGHERFFLTRRTMLFEDLPLTRLAARDGLLEVDAEGLRLFGWLARFCDPGSRRYSQQKDIPWRFRDPLVAAVCAITVRIAKQDAVVEDDPYHARIQQAIRAARKEGDPLGLFESLLDAAAAHGGPPSVDALMESFFARIPSPPPPTTAPERRDLAPEVVAGYRDLFAREACRRGVPLRGFRLADADAFGDALRLAFRRGDEEFLVLVAPDAPEAACYVRSGGLRFWYDAPIPALCDDRHDLMLSVARVFASRRR